jgi:competence protein ComEC
MWKQHSKLRYGFLCVLLAAFMPAGCAERDMSYYEPDLTPPQVISLSEEDGRISWRTDENAKCVLAYGANSGTYDHHAYNVVDGGMSHSVDLIDVEPGTYYVSVIATDPSGNESSSPETSLVVTSVPDTDNLRYTMVDVGWSDCHFLEFPNGTNVMVDAADDGGYGGIDHRAQIDAFLTARGVQAPGGIDYMVATHAHRDHYGGFISLLVRYRPIVFMLPDDPAEAFPYELTKLFTSYSIPTTRLDAGMSSEADDFLDWDPEHNVRVVVLSAGAGKYVPGDGEDVESSKGNNDSVVLKVTFGDVDIMLAADAEFFVEQRIIKAFGTSIESEVLKVGHHGNDDATSAEWLHYLKPRVGFISNSLAENDGVFDQSVINLLLDYGVDYYVTDRVQRDASRSDAANHGNLTVTTDGATYTVSSWKSS